MSHRSTLLALLLAASGLAVASAGLAGADVHAAPLVEPDPKTIVEVTGDAASGFGVHHYDGTALFPPTDSEARAECSEYDTRVARVRCRTEVRVHYRDLAELKRSLAYALSLSG